LNGDNTNWIAPGRWESSDHKITYTLADTGNGQSDLLIAFKDHPNDTITVKNWTKDKNVGLKLPDAKAPEARNVVVLGDIEKKIVVEGVLPPLYRFDDARRTYESSAAQGGAQDVINGLIGLNGQSREEMRGLGGNDGLSGRDDDDLIDGGEGDDLLLGGNGVDTLIGGAGDDLIFGSGMGAISMPEGPGFSAPEVPAATVELTRGFSWVSYEKDSDAQRWDSDTKTVTFKAPGVVGANVGPVYLSGIDGQYHVEVDGNVIDAGAGDDTVA
ncbi:MAG: hypothetical protein ABUU24_04980, partial [Variovorax sp.]